VITRLFGDSGGPSAVARAHTGQGWKIAAWCSLVVAVLLLGVGCASSVGPGTPTSSGATGTSSSGTAASGISGTQAAVYIAAMLPKLTAINAAVAGIPSTCDPSTMQKCRAAMQKIHDANAELEKTLAANTVPACLHDADAEMRASTMLMDQATHNGMNAFGGQDLTALQAMTTQFEQAGTHESRAMDLLQRNSC